MKALQELWNGTKAVVSPSANNMAIGLEAGTGAIANAMIQVNNAIAPDQEDIDTYIANREKLKQLAPLLHDAPKQAIA